MDHLVLTPMTAHLIGCVGKRRVVIVLLDGSIMVYSVFGAYQARTIARKHSCACWNF